MGRHTSAKPLPPDDPIYKGRLTIFTPASARVSTPSTKNSPKTPENPSEGESQPEKDEQ